MPASFRQTIREVCKGVSPWPLFVWGPPGTGKSCGALVLLDHAGGLYFTASSLSEDAVLISKGQMHYEGSGRPVTVKAWWQEIETCPLVVLDELGARTKVGDWHYDCVKRLIDSREGMPLLAISNPDLDQLAILYDDRVASRLAAGTVLHLGGDDRRLQR